MSAHSAGSLDLRFMQFTGVSFARKNMWVYEAANFHFFIYIYLKGWLVGGKARIYLTYQIEINMTSEKNG